MRWFVFVFLSVYTSMHALVYLKARVLLPERLLPHLVSIAFLTLMIFAPIGTRLLERNGHDALARSSAIAGYVWMGFIFIAFWVFLVVIAVDLLVKGAVFVSRSSASGLPGSTTAMFALVSAALICVYGSFEARNIGTERVAIATSKLPSGVDRFKIAQISDVHLGLIVHEDRLQRMIEVVHSESPDILVCTGDFVDGDIDRMDEISGVLEQVNPRYGKFAVTGNHEFYAGLDRSIRLIERMGFVVLRGESETVNGTINVVGVDDPAGGGPAEDEATILSTVPNSLFTLFLKHRPEVLRRSEGLFDLQLSGHTHRGQIFPFRFITGIVYPMQDGLYELDKGSRLYTSRGSGTWGPPIRFLSPPEVTIIELVRDTGVGSHP